MKRELFILVPALNPTGPIKGAIALANALAHRCTVTLVTVKDGAGAHTPIDSRVRLQSLHNESTLAHKVSAYRSLLERAGGRAHVASVSMCFSADMVNLSCRNAAVTFASVRGNLLENYRSDYGLPGFAFAAIHLMALSRFDHVVAMTTSMANQICRFSGRTPAIIGNFVDEVELESHRRQVKREGAYRFVFLGSLTKRKQPVLAVDAIYRLRQRGESVSLDIVGSGPLRAETESRISARRLQDIVRLRDFQDSPYAALGEADALLLPSKSEGVSRSALEALHLGVPCVLRDTDGNDELITHGVNGALFRDDQELVDAMICAAKLSRGLKARDSLLPAAFRQDEAARRYLELIDAS